MPGQTRHGDTAAITLIIALLAMLGPFSIDTVFPAFDTISREVGASPALMQQLTSAYMLSFAVMSLFHGPVSDAVGRKPVMVVGLLAYAVASAMCAVSGSFWLLVAGRLLQGASAGAAQILSRTVIRDLYVGPAAHRMMAQVSMIFSIAPAVAPVVGGLVLGVGSWRWVLWGLTGLGLVLAAAVGFGLPETHTSGRTRLRVRLVFASLRMVLTDGPFLKLAAASMLGGAAQFSYLMGAPIILVHLLGQGERDFWKLFVPLVSGMMVGSFLSSRLAHRVQPARLVNGCLVALLVLVSANVALVASPVGSRLPWALLVPPLMATAWSVCFPVLQLQMLDRFPQHRGAAASGQSFTMLLFNAALTGILVPLTATSMLSVAATSAAMAGLGAVFWWWYRR